MKREIKIEEFDVDIIGEQGRTLTPEDEQMISEFIRANKEKRRQEEVKEKSKSKKKISAQSV